MSNPFGNRRDNTPLSSGMARTMVAVTPNDDDDNVGTDPVDGTTPNIAIGLYIETAGDVTFLDADGNTVAPVAVPNNFYLVCGVKRVLATNTTATGIWALIA